MQSQATTAANTHAYMKQDFWKNTRVYHNSKHSSPSCNRSKNFRPETANNHGNRNNKHPASYIQQA
jgi:hypothetical protein